MYDYMLEEIEEELFNTSEAFELDKAWEGVKRVQWSPLPASGM